MSAKRIAVRATRRTLARRAVLAMIQDPIIGIDMVDDLEARIERAINVAEVSASDDDAIEKAAKLADVEIFSAHREKLEAIKACAECQRRKNRVGFPGMKARDRFCEAHQ